LIIIIFYSIFEEKRIGVFPLTGRPGHGGRRSGCGRCLVVRGRRRGRQRLGRPGRDHFGLGRVHAAVAALRVFQRRVVIALAEKLGTGRGLWRTLGQPAATAAESGRRRGRSRGRVRGFRRRHGVVFFPLCPSVLEPDLHLLTRRKTVKIVSLPQAI